MIVARLKAPVQIFANVIGYDIDRKWLKFLLWHHMNVFQRRSSTFIAAVDDWLLGLLAVFLA